MCAQKQTCNQLSLTQNIFVKISATNISTIILFLEGIFKKKSQQSSSPLTNWVAQKAIVVFCRIHPGSEF